MFEQNSAIQNQNQGLSLQKHAMKTFSIMGLGLLITAVIAFFCYESGFALRALLSMGSFSYLFLILIEFGVVIAFSKNLYNMNYTSAMVLFAVYCAITRRRCSILRLMRAVRSVKSGWKRAKMC